MFSSYFLIMNCFCIELKLFEFDVIKCFEFEFEVSLVEIVYFLFIKEVLEFDLSSDLVI